jgi:hypothetical protein
MMGMRRVELSTVIYTRQLRINNCQKWQIPLLIDVAQLSERNLLWSKQEIDAVVKELLCSWGRSSPA